MNYKPQNLKVKITVNVWWLKNRSYLKKVKTFSALLQPQKKTETN